MPENTDKLRLRNELRQRRRALTPEQRGVAAANLPAHACSIPDWSAYQSFAGYIAADAEIDPAPLLGQLADAGKQVYLPVIEADNHLSFAPWSPGDSLLTNRFGIPEPLPNRPRIPAGDVEVILLPLVGWDRHGGRLGMGGGFYDRSLAGSSTLKIGLGYACQEVALLPREPWDVVMDFIATETALHNCRR
ncbi:5-formyltetrahydrofolate cyclo-ligase [Haliea sp. E17]|uniref:5-formyltetrahydrofolate cyclo-ligase n=1 Tax=Haliea sp. E17 TaxID=3401576 RepID=UPI003AAB2E4D